MSTTAVLLPLPYSCTSFKVLSLIFHSWTPIHFFPSHLILLMPTLCPFTVPDARAVRSYYHCCLRCALRDAHTNLVLLYIFQSHFLRSPFSSVYSIPQAPASLSGCVFATPMRRQMEPSHFCCGWLSSTSLVVPGVFISVLVAMPLVCYSH